MKTYTVSQFAKMTGLTVKTLQRWDREGVLIPLRSPTNRRLYTEKDLGFVQGGARQEEAADDAGTQD